MTTTRSAFVTLDVFTAQRYKGNQVAVVDATGLELSGAQMQQIAREFNFSETVFLHNYGNAQDPRISIYTPVNEMDFAGHPVIGTGHVLLRHLLPARLGTQKVEAETLTLRVKAGPISLSIDRTEGLVSAEVPHNIRLHSVRAGMQCITDTQPILAINTGWQSTELSYPVLSVVRGVTYVLVDLTDSPRAFSDVQAGPSPVVDLDDGWSPSFMGVMYYRITNIEDKNLGKRFHLRVRMIAIDLEDPACGSGCCALTAYLALQDGISRGVYHFEIDQGSEIGRDSQIMVDVVLDDSGEAVSTIRLAGKAVPVTEGTIMI